MNANNGKAASGAGGASGGPGNRTAAEVQNVIANVIEKYLPEGVKYDINYNQKYNLFEVDFYVNKIREGDREACKKVAAVAVLLSYYNTDGFYRCHGYGYLHCRAAVWVQRFREPIRMYDDALKEAYTHCDKIFSEVEERLRKKEEERRRKEEEYERWRRKNLGECYASRLDYSVYNVNLAEIGRGMENVLKPGDKVAIDLDVFEDPCFIEKKGDEVYVEGYIPICSLYCSCKHSDFDEYAFIKLPLYIRGALPKKHDAPPPPDDYNELLTYVYNYNRLHVIAEYKGNKVLEIIPSADENDYDYYLATFMYVPHIDSEFRVESVSGATWYSAYDWSYSGIYDLMEGGGTELSACCDKFPTLIVLALIKRNEEAKIRFSVRSLVDQDEERYEATISAAEVKLRELTYEEEGRREEREEDLGCCC